MDWLLLEGTPTGGGVGPTPIPPTIAFDSLTINVVEGTPVTNVVRWQDTDTTAANPIASVVQTAGVGALGSLSNLTLTNGQATWSHTATLGDNGSVISVTITDGDGLQAVATFTLEVSQTPIDPGEGTTDCGIHTLPTTIVGTLSAFAKGVLDIPPGGNIEPEWPENLNGRQVVWNVPTEDDLPENANCTYGEVQFTGVNANPTGTNSNTINIGFELSWSSSHPTNAGQETWMLVTRIWIPDDGSENANENFSRTALFSGPAIGFETWPEVPIEWPPQYDGTLATPPWGGVLNSVDSANNTDESPVSTLTIDNNPGNPSIVRLEATTATSDSTFLAEEWHAVSVAGGVVVPTEGPVPPVLDLTADAGQTVTFSYWGIDSAGNQSPTVQETVVVPSFVAEKFCGPGEANASFQSGIASLGNGEKLTVRAGTYTLGTGGEPPVMSGWDLNGKTNVTIVFEPGAILAQGFSEFQIPNANDTPTMLLTGSATNCRVEGAEFTGAIWNMVFAGVSSIDNVFWDLKFESVHPSGMSIMLTASGSLRTIFGECRGDNLNLRHPTSAGIPTSKGGGQAAGTMIYVVNGAIDTEVWGGSCLGIGGNTGGSLFQSRDGVFIQNETTVGTRVRGFSTDNCRQGVLSSQCGHTRVSDCDLSKNRATGFQVEAHSGPTGVDLYSRNVEIRRCILSDNNDFSPGEPGGWVNDSKNVLVEDCFVINSGVAGARTDAANSPTYAPPNGGAGIKQTEGVIWRHVLIDTVGKHGRGGNRWGFSFKGVADSAFYNITVVDVGRTSDFQAIGLASEPLPGSSPVTDNERIVIKNCVFGEMENNPSGQTRNVLLKDGDRAFKDMDHNIYEAIPGNTDAYQIGQVSSNKFDFTGYQGQMTPHEANSSEVGDLMLDASRTPQAGSPLKDAAAPMATVNGTPAGNTIPLSDTTWIWVSIRPEDSDKIVFPAGTAKVISKTTTSVTIDAVPPGGIMASDPVTLLHKGVRANGNYPGMAAGTADAGAMQS